MTDLLRSVITILLIYVISRILFLFFERIRSIIHILSLKHKVGLMVRVYPTALLSLFGISKKTDATVEIGDTVYLIRFFNGRSSLSYVHFASKRFAVVYSKIHFSISSLLSKSARRGGARLGGAQDTSRQRVHIIPELKSSEERKAKEIIIFDPTPAEVTYVTETKTSIRAAYTGDEVLGRMIFTPETFVIYADRKKRAIDYEMTQKTH